jgi:GNAT superfamily N-acetyltransferase
MRRDLAANIDVRSEPIASAVPQSMIRALNAELSALYPEDGTPSHFRLDEDEVAPGRGVFLVAYADGEPRACGAIRLLDPRTAEVKRMYVAPDARGLGLGRRVLAELEAEARRLGARTVVLETGVRQPEAIAMYEKAGYSKIAAFGEYVEHPLSLFFGKGLA